MSICFAHLNEYFFSYAAFYIYMSVFFFSLLVFLPSMSLSVLDFLLLFSRHGATVVYAVVECSDGLQTDEGQKLLLQ